MTALVTAENGADAAETGSFHSDLSTDGLAT